MDLKTKIIVYPKRKLRRLRESIMSSDADVELKEYYIEIIDRRLNLRSYLIENGEVSYDELE